MLTAWIWRTGRRVALSLAALALTSSAFGSAFSTDNSDIYNATDETGWAVEMTQRGDVVFATIYTHDADNFPIYYSAALFFAGTNASGNAIWTGALIETQGPWFGAPFDGSKVVNRPVGTMTYVPQFIETGALTFTVDGVPVTKQINRFTFRLDNYAGNYVGAYKLVSSGCTNSANNGTSYFGSVFNITQAANSLTIAVADSQGTCTYTGDYTQSGQFGQTRGTFTCTDGYAGSHLFVEMNVTPGDFRARFIGSDNLGCSLTGNFSGVRQ